VTSGSPAEQAGLQEGDVLLKLDERPVASLREFSELLRTMKAGQQVSVVYRRGADERTASVTLVER
jgi:putative serine protease PepD